VVLIPGLIAAAFGASTWVPWEGERRGFLLMITLMVAGGLVFYRYVGHFAKGDGQ
jgi:hypothetical protein